MAGFPTPRHRIAVALSVAGLLAVGCGDDPEPAAMTAPPPGGDQSHPSTLLALGDSYTVGESVPFASSWPCQLADSLAAENTPLASIDILAETGWTTRDLLDGLRLWRADAEVPVTFGLVAVMIGVNDQFHGSEHGLFAATMDTLIALSLELAGGSPERVLGFSIPDYGRTPVGMAFDPERIEADIDRFNEILRQKYAGAGITMLDVTALSRQCGDEPGLVARDGLHFSGEMYCRWVEMMLPHVRHALGIAPAPRSAAVRSR